MATVYLRRGTLDEKPIWWIIRLVNMTEFPDVRLGDKLTVEVCGNMREHEIQFVEEEHRAE